MIPGGAGIHGGAPVLRVWARLGVVQARAYAGTVRVARAEAAGGRCVRVAGPASPRASCPPCAPPCAPRTSANASRKPQCQGRRAQAALVRLRRVRRQPPSPQETLKRTLPSCIWRTGGSVLMVL